MIKDGERVEVISIHPKDAHYYERSEYIHRIGIITLASKPVGYRGYHSGCIKFPDGEERYFWIVKIRRKDESKKC